MDVEVEGRTDVRSVVTRHGRHAGTRRDAVPFPVTLVA